MKELFVYLCVSSVVASVAVALAVVLRPILKKGPSFIRCILWALVFLRLLVPVGFVELPFSVPGIFDVAEAPASIPGSEANPAGDAVTDDNRVPNPVQNPVQAPAVQAPASDIGGTAVTPVTEPAAGTQTVTLPEPEREVDVLYVLSVVWAVGVAAMIGYMLASHLLLRYRVRNAIVYDSGVRVIAQDCSPFVFGFFRPIIYIPASTKKQDWQYIIAHESSHIKRFDHVLKPFAFLVLSVYWFHPLVWAAYLLFSKDIEYACDERTVKDMEGKDRKAYSLALLSVSQGENIIFAPPLSFGKVNVKERIKRVMNRKISVWAICLACIICASLLLLMACTPGSVGTENSDRSSADPQPSDSGNVPALALSVEYADRAELGDNSLFFDEGGIAYQLVKVGVNREVKNFRFIEVDYDPETTDPHVGRTLFEVASLTPDTPFYVNTEIGDILSFKGISFENEDGETVCYRIEDVDGAITYTGDLRLHPISSEPCVLKVFADYADPSELEENSLFFFDKENEDYLVRIWATKELKNFKFIEVVDDGPYAGETLFEMASLTSGKPFYAETVIGEGFSVRGISFEDENGETVYYRISYNGRGIEPGFDLEPIPANPAS